MKKNRLVDKYYKQIERAEKALNKIRANCKHKKYRIELYSWRIGSITPKRLCTNCDAVIPGITPEEAATLLDTFAQPLTENQIRNSIISLG